MKTIHQSYIHPTLLMLALATCFGAGNSMAAQRVELEKTLVAGSAATVHMRTGLTNDELRPLRSRAFANGNSATRFQQHYQGLPIWGEVIVERRAAGGAAPVLAGTVFKNLHLDLPSVVPSIAEAQAMQKAKALANARHSHNEQIRLVVKMDAGDKAKLAYLISFVNDSASRPSQPFMLIDANNGDLLQRWEGIHHVAGEGPGGNTRTGTYFYQTGGQYGPLDVTQSGSTCTLANANVKTINLNGATSGGTVHSFPCFRNGEPGTTAQATINDAHAFGTLIVNMYRDWLNLPALNAQMLVKINYGSQYENAFWDGTALNIGSGGSTTYPLVVLDVMSHEVSHGFTAQNSGLVYSGQAGGMNEAFSDMAGEAAEYYRNGSNDFLVGTGVLKAGGSLRNMCNPTVDGNSIDHASKFTSTMNVHYSSGVYNKAFCTLAKTTGWSTRKAFEVMAGANDLYWTSNSSFNSGACGVEKAATDRGYNAADVTAAFSVVGVSCTSTPAATPLSNGVAVGVSVAAGASKLFAISVPAGKTSLSFKLAGGTGNADLYVRATTPPTTTAYTRRSIGSSNTESITFSNPAAATYYVLVYGKTASSGASLVARY